MSGFANLVAFELVEVLRRAFVFLFDDPEIDPHRIHADHEIVLAEIHAVNAARLPAHRPNFRFAEENRLAVVAREENHLLAVGELGADQFVRVVKADGDDAGGTRIGKIRQLGFLHGAVARGEENVAPGFFEIARRDYRRERLAFLEAHETVDGLPARGRRRFGNFVNLQPVDAALRREQQNVAVRRGHEEVLDEIFLARLCADAPLAAARLMAIDVHRSALDIARMADGDGHVFVFDQVFELDVVHAIDDLRAAFVAVRFQRLRAAPRRSRLSVSFRCREFRASSAMRSRICASSFRISSTESCVRRCNCSSRMASI